MKLFSSILLSLFSVGFAHAQLNLYAVNQIGTGKWGSGRKISVVKWTASDATLSIDLENRNIYIYDKGISQHLNILQRINKSQSGKTTSATYSTIDENGLASTLGLSECDNQARLCVYSPDSLVVIYKITKKELNQ